ncbi:hypothetical protein Anas_06003 [Armadillidium nasatum]|uniref:Uncharacterized protein n=1 Tax=Armadillidium nasatum TaxID=96803 RepID=A0A5N5SSI2_9CRUS|nr:hypothetical protein Anas_06003 [Armadillidium nasatum]
MEEPPNLDERLDISSVPMVINGMDSHNNHKIFIIRFISFTHLASVKCVTFSLNVEDYEDSEMEEEEEDMEEDIHLEMEDNTSSQSSQKDDEIAPSNLATLVRLKANQRQDYLRGSYFRKRTSN